MVEIRTLQPIVRIRMPKAKRGYRPAQVKIVVRRLVDFPPPTPQPTPCRLWQGAQGSDGYGWRKWTDNDGKRGAKSVHRWVMEQALGRALNRFEVVLHACDQPLCYRIDHLSIGTVVDNNADMRAKGRDVKPPVNRFYGEAHPMAKLTEAQVRAIKGHAISGLSTKTIAGMFEISPTTVRRIIKGVTWRPMAAPSRDLLAEARARLAAAEAEEEGKHAQAAAKPPERIRRVKPMSLQRRRDV